MGMNNGTGAPSSFAMKAFPRPNGGVLLPQHDRRAAADGLCMYTASKPLPMAAQRLAFWLLKGVGTPALPGRSVSWEPPFPPGVWAALTADWTRVAGPFDAVAVYQRRQAERTGMTLLLTSADGPRAVVKVRDSESGLATEQQALRTLEQRKPVTFRSPRPLGLGKVDGVCHWSAQSAVFTRPHSPATHPERELFDEVPELLSPLFTTADARLAPAHNDLTIWNLRRDHRGALWLFDWEDCGLAPVGADETYFHTSLAGIRGRAMPPGLPAEAIMHWRRIVGARTATSAADKALAARMLEALHEADEKTAPPRGVTGPDGGL
jgi:hypothetical protein